MKFSDRSDVPRGTADIFYRRLKGVEVGELNPVVSIDGVVYMSVMKEGLVTVATSPQEGETCPALVLELLLRICRIFKDFSGSFSEESVRRNFGIFYEIIDEAIDAGFPQVTAVERLRICVKNEVGTPAGAGAVGGVIGSAITGAMGGAMGGAIAESLGHVINGPVGEYASNLFQGVLRSASGLGVISQPTTNANKTLPSSATERPLASGTERKNEIFVDIIEHLNVTVENGQVKRFGIWGSIQLKSYLWGTPELRIGLNDDLKLGDVASITQGGPHLIDSNYHESADLTNFDTNKEISMFAPEGEFTLMTYRAALICPVLPVQVLSQHTEFFNDRIEWSLRIRASVPENNAITNFRVTVGVKDSGKSVVGLRSESSGGSSAEWGGGQMVWSIKRISGGEEAWLRARLLLGGEGEAEPLVGPAKFDFEISMFSASNLQVKYLRINDRSNPARWVRYLTKSASYILR